MMVVGVMGVANAAAAFVSCAGGAAGCSLLLQESFAELLVAALVFSGFALLFGAALALLLCFAALGLALLEEQKCSKSFENLARLRKMARFEKGCVTRARSESTAQYTAGPYISN
jgi:hypothetical protein